MPKKIYPRNLPKRYQWHWDHPWRRRARRSLGFRRWLNRNGYLTPHFTIAEARCKDGTSVSGITKRRARRHAFNLERLRHRLGDKPVSIISWYRTKKYNQLVGGASRSKHIDGWATDHPSQWIDNIGRVTVMREANYVFRKGGLGVYPWGAIHTDSRGYYARWTDWVRTRIARTTSTSESENRC
jgi:hypothetical protein